MKSIDELNLWDPADEAIFDAYMAEERAKRDADPEYQRRKKNTQDLAHTMAYMLYPPGPYAREHLNRAQPDTDYSQDDAWFEASPAHPTVTPAARSSVRRTWGIGTVPVIRFDDDDSDPYVSEAC